MKNNNWRHILLVVSIALNLLFAGVLIGRSLSDGPFASHRDRLGSGHNRPGITV